MNTVLVADGISPAPSRADPLRVANAVLIVGTRIVQVGDAPTIRRSAPAGSRVQEFPGAYLVPGLIDAHVHLSFDPTSPTLGPSERTAAQVAQQIAANCASALSTGITTVRDLGDAGGEVFRFRAANGAAAGRPVPRIVAAGAPLTSERGHCWFLGGEVTNHHAAVTHVQQMHRAGADVIKVMLNGGYSTAGSSPFLLQFEDAILQTVTRSAGMHRLPIAAHAHTTAAIAQAVRMGATTIEHCGWLTEPPAAHAWDGDLVERIRRVGAVVCPTFSGPEWDRYVTAHGLPAARTEYQHITWMAQHGVRQILGTDAGIPGSPFTSLIGTMRAMVSLGFEPDEVLRMATSASADAVGLGEVTGRIKPNLDADILVVDGNPSQDLNALNSLAAMMRGGKDVDLPR